MSLKTDRLREIRERRGISQRELARLCGFSEVMIYRYESGISDPSATNLTVIAEKLGVSTDYLLGLNDSPDGPIDNTELSEVERTIIESFRREGWTGIVRLGAEHLPR
jgi:transcriptional regulator with XRE-family HTH domain